MEPGFVAVEVEELRPSALSTQQSSCYTLQRVALLHDVVAHVVLCLHDRGWKRYPEDPARLNDAGL
jgi:hypothetical protein